MRKMPIEDIGGLIEEGGRVSDYDLTAIIYIDYLFYVTPTGKVPFPSYNCIDFTSQTGLPQ